MCVGGQGGTCRHIITGYLLRGVSIIIDVAEERIHETVLPHVQKFN
jgi:hypothetical protein